MMLLRILIVMCSIDSINAIPVLTTRQEQGTNICDVRKQTQLIGGIQENMFIQKQELQGQVHISSNLLAVAFHHQRYTHTDNSSIQTLQSLSATGQSALPANATQTNFQLTQISVADTQDKGIAVRERNQRLADELESPSAKGLAQVAQMQVATMLDVRGLKQGDMKMLDDLVKRVEGAMKLNKENLKVAESGCTR